MQIFISYSHEDGVIVAALVKLLRASGTSVFRDDDSIPAGAPWRLHIDASIDSCSIVLVFWCSHSAMSNEVVGEYRRALSLGKTVVPVLLDDTPLRQEIAPYHGVDLRAFGPHAAGPRLTVANAGGLTEEDLKAESMKVYMQLQHRMAGLIAHFLHGLPEAHQS